MNPILRIVLAFLCFAPIGLAANRTFDFQYAFTVTGLEAGQTARIWFPQALSDAAQDVKIIDRHLPADTTETLDASQLNHTFYVSASATADGSIPLSVTYRVTRHEVQRLPITKYESIDRDLQADRLVPLGGKPAELLAGRTLPADDVARARVLFDLVFDSLTYSKEKPGWGRGDVNWVCDSRFGNCSDFHSLFLSLCRSTHLPAKMEFGFAVSPTTQPQAVGGYHCWAFFNPSAQPMWIPVDISEAKNHPELKESCFGHLDADRIALSSGRDLTLLPPQAGPPLNFLVDPYIEVDGQPWPDAKIQRTFRVLPVQSP